MTEDLLVVVATPTTTTSCCPIYVTPSDRVHSGDTLIRRIKAIPREPKTPVRCLGIDDFAFRKGQHDSTILIDLERGPVIDLLKSRDAADGEQASDVWPCRVRVASSTCVCEGMRSRGWRCDATYCNSANGGSMSLITKSAEEPC